MPTFWQCRFRALEASDTAQALATYIIGVIGISLLFQSILSGAEDIEWISSTRPLMERYCWDCHGAKQQKGDLDLQRFSASSELIQHTDVMAKIEERLSNGEMPPKRSQQPTPVEERH